jgi:hypothetical protein
VVARLVRLQAERVRPGADLHVAASTEARAVAAEVRRLIAARTA